MEVTPKWHAGAAAQLNKAAGAPSSDAAHLQTPPVLVIEPMKPKWKDMTADLLTQVFVEAQQFGTYRTLLRRRISFYLDEQAKLLPKTVLLTATLHCSGSPTAHQHTQPEASQGPHPLPSSAHDSTEGASSTQQPPDLGRQQQQALSLDHVSQRRSIQQSSSRSYESTGQQQQHSSTQGLGVAEGDAQCPSRSHRGADTACANHVPRMPSPLLQPPHSTSNSERGNASPVSGAANCESSSSSSSGREHGLASSGVGVELLVGTAEVSFDRITHGRHLYLNPPNKSAYLCNMAVDPQWRQLGIGRALLEAVEQLAIAGQEDEMYLHMRVKDVPAARLYNASGYKEVGRDLGWLSRLLCRDQKMLLAKRLRRGGYMLAACKFLAFP